MFDCWLFWRVTFRAADGPGRPRGCCDPVGRQHAVTLRRRQGALWRGMLVPTKKRNQINSFKKRFCGFRIETRAEGGRVSPFFLEKWSFHSGLSSMKGRRRPGWDEIGHSSGCFLSRMRQRWVSWGLWRRGSGARASVSLAQRRRVHGSQTQSCTPISRSLLMRSAATSREKLFV